MDNKLLAAVQRSKQLAEGQNAQDMQYNMARTAQGGTSTHYSGSQAMSWK